MYTQEWYDSEKEKAEAEGTLHIFQQEVERNAAASLESVCCPPEWVASSKRNETILNGLKIAALDPANEGGDTHGFVVVDGNQIIHADESGEGDPGEATDKYFWRAVKMECDEFRYDPIGIGAAVSSRLKEILKHLAADDPGKKIKIRPWNAGAAVIRPNEKDYAETKNEKFFKNSKSQAWWKVRHEFLQTYRAGNGKEYKPDEIISVGEITRKIEKLFLELSQPQYIMSVDGKLLIDKKPKGTKSPNIADAYIMCRAEVKQGFQPWTVI